MVRTLFSAFILGLLLFLASCSTPEAPEPAIPELENAPVTRVARTPAVLESVEFEPAEPAVVDMSDSGGSSQDEEELEMEGDGLEEPAPGVRQPLAQLVEQARLALAERLGRTIDDVTLESAEEVTWPDASLGCPDPEMMYAQVLTPGYRLIFAVAEETYTYHSDRSGRMVLCGPGGAPAR